MLQGGALYVFAVMAVVCAIAVVVSQNVVRMAFWLILSLGAVAGLFFSLNADFVGAAQLLIYVGGTLVLLIFGVMLTASGPFLQIRSRPGEMVLGGVVGLALLALILSSAISVDWSRRGPEDPRHVVGIGFNPPAEGNTARELGMKFLGASPKDVGAARTSLSPGFLLPFEIVSVHLLVVLIGAAYLARAKRRKETPISPAS
ncbi:MAG: NADH-quinone oxidoreductase subunit J [Planctomycetaceae bacterium]|nr:MAG: NADH-quinone oxidoreductase subunit J [Planctomycetaceae bacterium]